MEIYQTNNRFNLLNYINTNDVTKETPTYLYISCPICYGNRLGISKKNGAYKCYTNFCDSKLIRKYFTGIEVDDYIYRKEIIQKIERKDDINLIRIVDKYFLTTFLYKEKIYFSASNNCNVEETSYFYDEFTKVVRYDYLNKEKRKDFVPKYYIESEKKWINGKHSDWKLYNEYWLQQSISLSTHANSVCIAEGEKVAKYIVDKTKYLCLSPPGFGWNDDFLYPSFLRLFPYINGIIYLKDNDEAGNKKAQQIQQQAWKAKLWCEIIYPSIEFNDFADVEDLDRNYLEKLVYEIIL